MNLTTDDVGRLLVTVLERGSVTVEALSATLDADERATGQALAALDAAGLTQRTEGDGHVLPGAAILRFGRQGLGRAGLTYLARDVLRHLADETGETVNLMMPATAGCVAVAQEAGHHFLGAYNWLGEVLGAHCTAGGKVFLAAGVVPALHGALARRTGATITDPDALERELAVVRERGWATIVEELEQGLSALAAPVRDAGGEVIAAVSVSGPTARLHPERMRVLGPIVVAHAAELASRLGHEDRRWQATESYSHGS